MDGRRVHLVDQHITGPSISLQHIAEYVADLCVAERFAHHSIAQRVTQHVADSRSHAVDACARHGWW